MPTFTITIPSENTQELLEAFAKAYNYHETTTQINGNGEEIVVPNPISKAQHAKNHIIKYIKEIYKGYKLKDLETQRQALLATGDTESSGFTIE